MKTNPILYTINKVVILFVIFCSSWLQAQVGINTTSPDSSAMLDVYASNKGMLVPRIALTGTNDVSTIATPVNSLLIYNTTTTSGVNAVVPGFYYYETASTRWIKLSTAASLQYFAESRNTAVPNNTIPSHMWKPIGTETNIDLVLSPKGTGAILAQMPDNTSVGGNKRGLNALDLQTSRQFADQVASGQYASILGGVQNKASGTYATAMGFNTIASGDYATAMGAFSIASGGQSTAIGQSQAVGFLSTSMGHAYASGNYSTAMGEGTNATGDYSTAMGQRTTASGLNSTSMGYYTNALGDYSTATGFETTASGKYSFAAGRQTTASGESAVAMGSYSNATGTNSFAVGSSTASGAYSVAMGASASASGLETSVAIGHYVSATGRYSTAMGSFTIASGQAATTLGSDNKAIGDYSTAMGIGNTAASYSETAIGYYGTNYIVATNGATQINATDRLFNIGNGVNSVDPNLRSDAFTILKNGNTGISKSTPNSTLEVNGTFATVVYSGATSTVPTNSNYAVYVYKSGVATITLPTATACTNRRYRIVNKSGADLTISSFINLSNSAVTTLANTKYIEIISDGTLWQQIGGN